MSRIHRRRKRAEGDDGAPLEMTSMIDVVFLLLIFFMCATKFRLPEGQLRTWLPKNRGGKPSTPILKEGCRITMFMEGNQTIVLIDSNPPVPYDGDRGEFELATGRPPGPNKATIRDYVSARKAAYFGQDTKGLPVTIDFAKEVPWKYVVDVIDVCAGLEIADISIAAPEIPIE